MPFAVYESLLIVKNLSKIKCLSLIVAKKIGMFSLDLRKYDIKLLFSCDMCLESNDWGAYLDIHIIGA